jgi:flagellar motor component MotA
MNMKKMIGWLAIAATAVLLMVLKRTHLGVLHYNWFMIILMAWCLGLVVFFRMHNKPDRTG